MARRHVDLDAVHRAREEQAGTDRPEVTIGGTSYELPLALPGLTLVSLGLVRNGDLAAISDVVGSLFGDENVAAVLAAGFDIDDIDAIIEGVYGDAEGEAPASAPS